MPQSKFIWESTLDILQNELSAAVYNGFIVDIIPIETRNKTLYLQSSNVSKQNFLNERYKEKIVDALKQCTGQNMDIEIVLPGEIFDFDESTTNYPVTLNERYTFDSFVIGQSNHFAHAAANGVADNPGKSYNPLFIYGGVGLGKTHLMHAIGNKIFSMHPDFKIMYVTSEKFTNEMIAAIRSDKNEEFREKYRNLDVLMIDDIQFISNKEGTQVEFFNTFNHLYEDQKQIVISSDKPPKEIPTLEERLRSRFEWGLQVDIVPPDYETRVAILQKKAEMENLNIPQDVMEFIAEKVQSNIRELEGTLTRVVAYSNLLGRPVDNQLAYDALKDFFTQQGNIVINIDLIKNVVADYYKINVSDLEGRKRHREVTFPRQVAMYLSRNLTEEPLVKIGEFFGDRHHSTVIHDIERIENELKNDPRLKTTMDDLIGRINE